MITLSDIEAAQARLDGRIRRTPLIKADNLSTPITTAELYLKLECLQVTGSFKARGATNRLLATPERDLANGIVTASGGNHGVAVARTGKLAGVAATVFVPTNVSPSKVAKLKQWGATVEIIGNVFDDADKAARAYAREIGAVYFHPFADPLVMAGQGTLALEILDELPDVDTFLIAIGGGGLIGGMGTAIRALRPQARIIGIEPVGCPTLKASLDAGHVVTIPKITSAVATMSCARTDERVFERVRAVVDDVVLVEDQAMIEAARWLWFELGLAADLSGAAAVSALRDGLVSVTPGEKVCALVCGAGPEGLS
ncbi:pyridoxal-phosphate dependent enzyme [Kaistia dalseonensis]|uniref:Threonine dehydratase n=1 Tax=Kaistia dalseonensis TaxID=410840 RepID=A0ABU0H8W3_9HYPH|nr:pyridoxal-phosphate dependent enzyme [Kaistia dalseonensis]MCX5496146.1 pyridoxal-phosphate dependent enzyme [Kaistia dalseonensis]MDQ0438755.1 threonine dehydratase [Kaistia dalseonensis]